MPNRRRGALDRYAIALVTVPDQKVARRIARVILENRVGACVNILPGVESHYWWQGKLEQGKELLLLIKTTRARLTKLEETVLAHHPYDTPEFIVLAIDSGNRRYLEWIRDSVETRRGFRPGRRRSGVPTT